MQLFSQRLTVLVLVQYDSSFGLLKLCWKFGVELRMAFLGLLRCLAYSWILVLS